MFLFFYTVKKIIINNIQDYTKKEETIVIKENEISFIDGNSCYKRVLSKDIVFINDIENELSNLNLDVLRWVITEIDEEFYYLTLSIVKD